MNIKEKMSLVKRLKELVALLHGTDLKALSKLKYVKETKDIIVKLKGSVTASLPIQEQEVINQEPQQVRKSTANYFSFDENEKLTKGIRQKRNDEAIKLLEQIGEGIGPTENQKLILAQYSGNGGGIKGADGLIGSDYEYYTPKPVAEGVWSLLDDIGFTGGKVLDPCAGVGIFGATAPINTLFDSVELDQTSGKINALVNAGAGYNATIAPFESFATNTEEESYDAIVTNVPFSKQKDARGANRFLDPMYQQETIEHYFILRSMRKLKPNGLAAFIVPPRITSGRTGKDKKFRTLVSEMAEFLGAYRLPNKIFGNANANTITDVIVFRKFNKAIFNKIQELKEQNMPLLVESNVFWQEYLDGNYFKDIGRKYVLGQFVNKDSNKFRDVDRVINDDSITNIAKLMRKFGGSHIDWALLEQEETVPITYQEGDSIVHAGQTLQMQNGTFIVVGDINPTDNQLQAEKMMGSLSSPHSALISSISWDEALNARGYYLTKNRANEIPSWASILIKALIGSGVDEVSSGWEAILTGLSLEQVLIANNRDKLNYLEKYDVLSEHMKTYFNFKAPSHLNRSVRGCINNIRNYYTKKGGYSDFWQGNVGDLTKDIDPDSQFEAIKYQSGSMKVPLSSAIEVFGDQFTPSDSDDWCVTDNGESVIKADDYFIGNYGEFLKTIEEQIETAPDAIKQKLLRMKGEAEKRIERVDLTHLQVTLRTPLISAEDKLKFIKEYISKDSHLVEDEATGQKRPDIDNKGSDISVTEKLQNRIGDYIKNGTITLGSLKLEGLSSEEAINQLKQMVNTANTQFNIWVKSNPIIMGQLSQRANDPSRLYFKQKEDDSPLTVKGINKAWQLHGYQAAEVRRLSRDFSGINGFDVGLGKTFASLAAVQHMQNIGIKKKTIFVVPNSVLAKWHKEVIVGEGEIGKDNYRPPIYEDGSECLFVGLTEKDGETKVNSANVDKDLTRILDNKHSKIFMTFEAFSRIRLQEETLTAYADNLGSVEKAFESSSKKGKMERVSSRKGELVDIISKGGKANSAPYLEQMGIDSLVIDEAHTYKNSKEIYSFKGGKFLSLPEASARGLDAQIKTWYIRGQSPKQDGVLCLTATPLTNSPLEIYSMTVLAVGEQKVNNMVMGIKGADDFMDTFCMMDNENEMAIDGTMKSFNVFAGLTNVPILRKLIHNIANIKDADDVGNAVKLPDSEEADTPVVLDEVTTKRLGDYKRAYRLAKDYIDDNKKHTLDGEDMIWLTSFAEERGEPVELLAHPFNLIKKMTDLINDPDLDKKATFFTFDDEDLEKAQLVVDLINKKKMVEERVRAGAYTSKEAIIGQRTIKDDSESSTVYLKIQVMAEIVGNQIIVDTIDSKNQQIIDSMIDTAKLDVSVTIPPKIAALLENFKNEMAHPRGLISEEVKAKEVKQIVFCDSLSMHSKLKRVLIQKASVPSSKIMIVTGQTNGKPEEVQDVQDGFNAFGEENRFTTVIGNEKIEVGINLQRGTQAMHHLTIGWTPDSKQQRDGRGKRQGNATDTVNIYVYDAFGTFDQYKRRLVSKKNDWIQDVLSHNDKNEVQISGGLSKEQMDLLIDSVGDANAMEKIQSENERFEKENRIKNTQTAQTVQLETYLKAQNILDRYQNNEIRFIFEQLESLKNLLEEKQSLESRKSRSSVTEKALVKIDKNIIQVDEQIKGISDRINECGTLILTEDEKEKEIPLGSLARSVNYYSGKADQFSFKDKKEDAPLLNEFKAILETNTNIARSAKKEFMDNTGKEGALDSEFMENADGKGVGLLLGQLVHNNMFVHFNKLGYCVLSVEKPRYGKESLYGDVTINYYDVESPTLKRSMRSYQIDFEDSTMHILNKNSDEFRSWMMADFAKQEDDFFAKGNSVSKGTVLFSKIFPEVATLRKVKAKIEVKRSEYLLPSPYFPYVYMEKDSTVISELLKTQQGFGFENGSYNMFTVSQEQFEKLVTFEKGDNFSIIEQIISFMKAHNLKFSDSREFLAIESGMADLYGYSEAYRSFIEKVVTNVDEVAKAIEDSDFDNEVDLYDFIKARLTEVLVPYFNQTNVNYKGKGYGVADFYLIEQSNDSQISRFSCLAPIVKSIEDKYNEIKEKIKLKDEGASSVDETAKYVAILGDTYKLNKAILIRGAAKKLGGEVGFVGSSIKSIDKEICGNLPDAPTNSWVMSNETYIALQKRYPTAFDQHNIRLWSR